MYLNDNIYIFIKKRLKTMQDGDCTNKKTEKYKYPKKTHR